MDAIRKTTTSFFTAIDLQSSVCCESGCQGVVVCGPPELDITVHRIGPDFLASVVKEWAGLEHVFQQGQTTGTVEAMECEKVVSLDDATYQRWQLIGSAEGLSYDWEVGKFLIQM